MASKSDQFYSMFRNTFLCCMPKKDEVEIDFENKQKKEIDNMNYKNDE